VYIINNKNVLFHINYKHIDTVGKIMLVDVK